MSVLSRSTVVPQVWRHTDCFRSLEFENAYLGQTAYQHSVIAVAVKGMLVEQILCETGYKNDKGIA